MVREYDHIRQDIFPVMPWRPVREELIPYKNSKILAIQVIDNVSLVPRNDRNYTVVPGFVIEYRQEKRWGHVPVSLVEPINKEEMPDVEKLVREHGFRGDIQFWSRDDEFSEKKGCLFAIIERLLS